MDHLLYGLLALSVLFECNRAAVAAAVNVTGADLMQEISTTLCTVNYFTLFGYIFRYCTQDDVPASKCDVSFTKAEHNDNGRFALGCHATCPNQTASDVVWNIHLLSNHYNISLSCHDNNCTSDNEYTRLLRLEQEFTTDSNNTLHFHFSRIYEKALMGCVVNTGDCVSASYWSIRGVDKDHIARITNPSNKQVYRVALGEQLNISCEGYGDGDNNNLLYWYDGQSVVTQYVGYCAELDINNSSCIPLLYEEYRASRVKSYRTRLHDCSISARQRSLLDISIVNWTDSVSSYTCVSTKEGSTSQLNVTVYVTVDVLPEFLESPPSYVVSNTTTSYHSCVAKAGWGAKLLWFDSSGAIIPEYSPTDTYLPSLYVTYSLKNVSTLLRVKDPGYTVDPVNSVYPVHNATLHINGRPYHDQNGSFTCVITGVNMEFLRQYKVTDDKLRHSMLVYINTPPESSPQSSDLATGFLISLITGAILILVIIILITFFCYAQYRQQSKSKTLSIETPFGHFTAESAIDSKIINEKIQFPRERITLLHVIGEGHFGRVWKAKAEGIVRNAPHRNIVAIKTTKNDDVGSAAAAYDLWSELGMLLKVEPHPNICNLLGYCDDKVKSLYIILEYCMLGRLKDYLQNCHKALVELEMPVELRNYKNSPSHVQFSSCSTDYVNILQTSSCSSYAKLLMRRTSVGSTQSDSVFYDGSIAYAPESVDSDYNTMSYAGSVISLYRDYANTPGSLHNEDIANFAFQIACGLQHLEQLKIYHGDLSARNILIAEGFLLKIADFGLARELNSQEYYRRQTERDLPVKWMPIESLGVESLCTHKSDIWSYGVVLWEIATYGKSPYEGVPIADMLQHLEEGNRLPCPHGCSDAWYKLMLRCWSKDAELRPSASELTKLLVEPPFHYASDPDTALKLLTTAV